MVNALLIFIGAGLGGLFRYWISNGVHLILSREFPYGTFLVNLSGCFFMGLFYVLIFDRMDGHGAYLRSLLLIGLLGGYTTFSSFSIETLNLFENGAWLSAFINIFLSTCLCIIATWLGVMGARQL